MEAATPGVTPIIEMLRPSKPPSSAVVLPGLPKENGLELPMSRKLQPG